MAGLDKRNASSKKMLAAKDALRFRDGNNCSKKPKNETSKILCTSIGNTSKTIKTMQGVGGMPS